MKQMTSIYVEPEVWAAFKEKCKKEGKVASEVVRELIAGKIAIIR